MFDTVKLLQTCHSASINVFDKRAHSQGKKLKHGGQREIRILCFVLWCNSSCIQAVIVEMALRKRVIVKIAKN